jgi:ribonucleotide reductase alpha subunit
MERRLLVIHRYKNPKNGLDSPLIADDVYQIIKDNIERLQNAIDYKRDFRYDYFGFKTLERSYLVRLGGRVVERPQHMLVRAPLELHITFSG